MSSIKRLIVGISALFLGGCAHPIKVGPDIAVIDQKISTNAAAPARIGYYIPPELLALEVTTPGGGGDNVRYYPYRDIEPGFERLLSKLFSDVVRLPAPPAYSGEIHQKLDYVFEPLISTSSGSTGFFTWPPTNFSVDLTSTIRDASGKMIASPRVLGVGTAGTSERIADHGIAGRRAMEDALVKMQVALRELSFLKHEESGPLTHYPPRDVSNSAASRLTNLSELMARGLISKGEYDAKRKEIIDKF